MLPRHIQERTPAPHAVDVFLAGPDLPFFAEYAAFCWGRIDFESRGDCARPTDRRWGWLEMRSRQGEDKLLVFRGESPETPAHFPHPLRVEATASRLAWLAAYFTMRRAPAVAYLRRRGHMVGYGALAEQLLADEDVESRWERCRAVRGQFEAEALRPYDTMAWWGGWKHEGAFSSPGARPLRRLMQAVLSNDASALPDFFEALSKGLAPEHRSGYVHALAALTGKSFATDAEWLAWWHRIKSEQ